MASRKISSAATIPKRRRDLQVAIPVERIIIFARPSCQIGKTVNPCPKLNWADTLEGVTLRADQYIE
jgi:hypothetical protein